MANMTNRRFLRLGPSLVLIGCGLFFLLPLISLTRFALQNVPTVNLGWSTLFDKWSLSGITKAFSEPGFGDALTLSLKLMVGTVILTLVLLMPTAIWVHLRLPKARPLVEFLTVLPYVIPAIALVAGIVVVKPHARWFLDSEYSLIPFYVTLALPFTYRSIDAGIRALDLGTLVDASRSLGAGWGTTLRRALIPNLRSAIISSTFLIAAVVLGEYTMANVLLRFTLQPFLYEYRSHEPQGGYGLALLVMLATTLLFAVLGMLTRPRGTRRRRVQAADMVTTVPFRP
jgi:putative spermidine/putrescine transport system permease protein